MSKINQIETALLEVEGGLFQNLANAYLHKLGYEHLNTIGSVLGSNKTKKGTPDTLVRLDNGNVNFAEFTTTQNKLAEKIQDDIEKCLDESKTGVSISEIENIIICHNSHLSAEEEQSLYKLCQKNNVQLQMRGLSAISYDLLQKYPGIAKDLLGIDVDTGQIVDPEEFVSQVGKNQLTTPLDMDFYFREDEIQAALTGLDTSNIITISGPAGVGKSRLALKVLEEFKIKNPSYKLRCIHNKGLDLFEDSKVYFSEPGCQLVLIDDANRISQFSIILDILRNQREDQSIKFVITVRDYAKEKIDHEVSSLGEYEKVELTPLEDDQISEMVKKLYDITNPSYLDRIVRIASGNPRLAIMAARVAKKHNTLESISDVTSLYDEYFSSITGDLKSLENEDVLKVAGIITLLRSVDKSNEGLMSVITSTFNISSSQFWGAAVELHNCEIVDIYENEVVKISDQVFATYLFYLTFLKDKILDVNILFEDAFLEERSNRVRDSVYPCFEAFDFTYVADIFRSIVKNKWTELIVIGDKSKIQGLISLFWFLIKSEVLVYVKNEIRNLELSEVDLESIDWEPNNISYTSHPLLEILLRFGQLRDDELTITSIELCLEYVKVRQEALPHFVDLIYKHYSFDVDSHKYDYHTPKIVINYLWSKTEEGEQGLISRLYLALVPKWLRIEHESHVSKKDAIIFQRYNLVDCETIGDLRKVIWDGVIILIKKPQFEEFSIKVLGQYSQLGMYLSDPKIVEKDLKYIKAIISDCLDPDNISHCILVHGCLQLMDRKKITSSNEFKEFFSSTLYELYYLLNFDYTDALADGLNYNDYKELRGSQIKEYARTLSINNFKCFIDNCGTILSVTGHRRDRHLIDGGIEQLLICIAAHDKNIFQDIIRFYLGNGDSLNINPWNIVKSYIELFGGEETLQVIENSEFENKPIWEFAYYQYLPQEEITSLDCKKLLSLYKNSKKSSLPYDFSYLLNYSKVDHRHIVDVVKIILDRTRNEKDFGNPFNNLFYSADEQCNQLYQYFKKNEGFLENAYLQHVSVDQHADYDSANLCLLLENNPEFLNTYFYEIIYKSNDYYFSGDTRDYSSLWLLADYKTIIQNLFSYVLEISSEDTYKSESLLKSIFGAQDHPNRNHADDIKARQNEFLLELVSKQTNNSVLMELVFEVISHFNEERRGVFIEEYVQHNQSIDNFKRLSLDPLSMSWSGSAVPVYQKKLEYWESLLPTFSSARLLEHKLYIEQRIQSVRITIENEKKRDFVGADW